MKKTSIPDRAKSAIRRRLGQIILWAAKPLIADEIRKRAEQIATELGRRASSIEERVQSVMALDVPVGRDHGMIIVVARLTAGRDLVKVVDLRPGLSAPEVMDMVKDIELAYCGRPEFVDEPSGFLRDALRSRGPVRRAANHPLSERRAFLLDDKPPSVVQDDWRV